MKIWGKTVIYSLWATTLLFLFISLIMLGQKTGSSDFNGNGFQYLSTNGFAKTFKIANFRQYSYNTSNLSYIGSALQLLSIAVPIFILISTGFTIYFLNKLKLTNNKVAAEKVD